MIGIGLVSLLLAVIDHRRHMQLLKAAHGTIPASLSAGVAVLSRC